MPPNLRDTTVVNIPCFRGLAEFGPEGVMNALCSKE